MALASSGWPPLLGGEPPPPILQAATPQCSYANSLIPDSKQSHKIVPVKEIKYVHGEPTVLWEEEEVNNMIVQENLQFAVVGKFSYGWPELDEIRKIVPLQCEIKSECKIGFLRDRHILIRLTTLEDYVHIMSKPAYFLKAKDGYYQMRPLKWEPWFTPETETSKALAWISFPSLSPNFFVKESLFTMAQAVGKPLHVDMATKNQSRPSCAKVKVEVDLLRDFPKRINVGIKKAGSGEIVSTWIKIKYDYMPKYCKTCKLQGHKEEECFIIHPELRPAKEENQVPRDKKNAAGVGVLSSGKVVSHNEIISLQSKEKENQQNTEPPKPKYPEHELNYKGFHVTKDNRVFTNTPDKHKQMQQLKQHTNNGVVQITNSFDALVENEDNLNEKVNKGISCKPWVEASFGKKQQEVDTNLNGDNAIEEHNDQSQIKEVADNMGEGKIQNPKEIKDTPDKETQKEACENKEGDMNANANTQIKLNPQAQEFVPKNVNEKKNELAALLSDPSPTNVYDIDMDNASIGEDEDEDEELDFDKVARDDDSLDEDEELDACFDKVARDGDISPRHQRSGSHKNKKKAHGRRYSWDGKVTGEFVPRHLPMRLAKQNHMIVSIDSSRFNKLKKK